MELRSRSGGGNIAKGAISMRNLITLTIFAGLALATAAPASALPSLPDRSAVSGNGAQSAESSLVQPARARHSVRRRYDWTYYPYFRPYYYYYWQFYYPSGGPLF
jgi:hypothetical protein